jgi:hypothetical protein
VLLGGRDRRKAYRVLVWKPEERRPRGRHMHRLENNSEINVVAELNSVDVIGWVADAC